MTTQVQDPSIPPASGKCHFFRLPPELRTVIYDQLLEDVEFDEEDEDDEDEELDLNEYEDSEEEDDQAIPPETTTGIDGVQGIDIDIDTEDEEEDDDDEDMEDSSSETSNIAPRLTRPPFLNTCRLIRQEAAPIYNYRLTNIAIEILKETTSLLDDEQELKDSYEHSPWLRNVVMKETYGMNVQTRMCVDVLDDEMRSLGLRLGVDAMRSGEANAKLSEVLERYESVSSTLFEVPPGVEGEVSILPRHG